MVIIIRKKIYKKKIKKKKDYIKNNVDDYKNSNNGVKINLKRSVIVTLKSSTYKTTKT